MNKYQKYPLNCSSCNALTPHTLISTFNDDEQSKEKPSAFSFIRVLGFSFEVFWRSLVGSSYYIAKEKLYRCDKCGKVEKH
ncbi:hypothetical protein CGH79_24895 [Vibrio parahaemolyticus]|uniref:hypothetical protein n=1 Tax=Vibrio parahaemolyticus TaxID=670 RepID=UPI00112105C5|nr:hypothetical protein [Vibrio parahaemolyticus]EGR0694188.1 hypothetical protein [Vibrio parahaemolyticus]TOM29636.1 hypothetical protein CGH79_24895 [Vibrio parahaemolyticus]TOM93685.1 hypothetical protein CGH65_25175 [Vibrio parahaemolyticus]